MADRALSADFRWYWLSQTASFVGDRLTGFTAPTIAILVLHAPSAQVGVLSATGWLAYPVFGMIAGALLAHVRRRPVLVAGELTRFAAFAIVGLCAVLGWISVTGLVVAVAVAGVATVFGDVASQSYLPSIVGQDSLFGTNSRLQSSDSLSKLIGPAVAGVIISAVGPLLALAVNALPFLLSSYGQGRVRVREAQPVAPAHREPIPRRIRQGLSFVRRDPLLRQIVCGSAVRSFGIGIVDTVLLLFAYRALGLTSVGGGFLLAAGSLGGITGALLTTRLAARLGTRRTLLLSGLEGFSWVALPLCLLTAPVAVLVVIRVFSSVWLPVWAVLTTSLRQSLTPATQQSTVAATARTLVASATPAGSLVGGVVAGAAVAVLGTTDGLVTVLTAGGLIASTSVLMLLRASRAIPQRTLVTA